jgi:ABC-2 type transport system permease protein
MTRIFTIVRRYVLIHFKSPARLLDLFFWPVMELFVWGFFTIYLRQTNMDAGGRLMVTLLNALIFWDILYRSQQALSLAFMEELWTRNVLNLLISPLRTWEWVVGAYFYGLLKTGIIVAILLVLATFFYAFSMSTLGFYLFPLPLICSCLGLEWDYLPRVFCCVGDMRRKR